MLKKGFKQRYHITFIEITNVPESDVPYVLEWKRGDKAQNKGVLTPVSEEGVCLVLAIRTPRRTKRHTNRPRRFRWDVSFFGRA